jgi:hypothetical protein
LSRKHFALKTCYRGSAVHGNVFFGRLAPPENMLFGQSASRSTCIFGHSAQGRGRMTGKHM